MPERVSVPLPDFVRPAVPSMIALMVAVFPDPRAFTVTVGVTPARMRLLVAVPLLSRTHPAAVVVLVSPKIRPVRVRSESSLTVLSAVRLSVLKLAVEPRPSATMPPDQFPVVLQEPPETVWVHVPSAARASRRDNAATAARLPASQGWNRRRIRATQHNAESNSNAIRFPTHLRLVMGIPQTDCRLETKVTTPKD